MIEINLDKLERGTHKAPVKVTRGGKTFYQQRRVGRKDKRFDDIKSYPNVNEFVRKNVKKLKEIGVTDMEAAGEFYNTVRMGRFTPKDVSIEVAVSGITDNIRNSVLEGWFRGGDKNYKIHIFNSILNNDDARNGTLKIMHHVYQTINNIDIPFNEFINSDIKLYRGGDMTDDVFTSFTLNKSIAEKFSREYGTDKMTEITVKPIETLGCGQSTMESEVMIPKALLSEHLNKNETYNDKIPSDFDKYLAHLRLKHPTLL